MYKNIKSIVTTIPDMDNELKINAMNYLQNTSPELVAKQLGLTRQTIHNLKSGRKNLRLIYCLAIAFLTNIKGSLKK